MGLGPYETNSLKMGFFCFLTSNLCKELFFRYKNAKLTCSIAASFLGSTIWHLNTIGQIFSSHSGKVKKIYPIYLWSDEWQKGRMLKKPIHFAGTSRQGLSDLPVANKPLFKWLDSLNICLDKRLTWKLELTRCKKNPPTKTKTTDSSVTDKGLFS